MEQDKAKKFFFDINDFDEEAIARKRAALRNAPPTFSVEQMEAARKEAYDQGHKDGRAETLASIEKQTMDLVGQILAQIKHLEKSENARTALFSDQSALLASTIVARLFPVLTARFGQDEMAGFIEDAVRAGLRSGVVSVHIHPERLEAMTQKLAADINVKPYLDNGKVVLVSDPAVAAQECQVTWPSGGAFWSPQAMMDEITRILAPVTDAVPDGGIKIDETAGAAHNQTENTTPAQKGDETP